MSKPQFYVPGTTPAGWQSVGASRNPYDAYGQSPMLDQNSAGAQPMGGQYRAGGYPGMGPPLGQPGMPAGGMGMGYGGPGPSNSGAAGPASQGSGPLNDVLFGAGSGLIQSGLGAYGQRLFGSGRDYVKSNMDKYFSPTDLQYYFQVNHQYVRNKLKLILFPFLHRGHWTRIAEQVAGGLTYKPPRGDMNAPDLYIPLMACLTYILLGAVEAGLRHKFNPGVMNAMTTRALVAWAVETLLLRAMLYVLGTGDAPLLDLVAYAGYTFVGVTLSLLGWTLVRASFYPLYIWTCLSSAMFLVRTMKRVLFTETRQYDRDSTRHRYMLLMLGAAQFPLSLWLCSV